MSDTPAVSIRGLRRAFGTTVAVAGLDLDVNRGEMLTILGPSGCGKTTVLRCIAGLETPDAGTIALDGRSVTGTGPAVPPERRRVGMVFQDVALFPHLSVADNVGYGLRRQPGAEDRVDELLALIELADVADRMPHQLSGGMQQRVAVARALAPRPSVILLDEPFSGLDASLRPRLREDLRTLLRGAGTAAILVTHDQDEALTLGDRVAVMRSGRIEQLDPPDIVYAAPSSAWVASFVGTVSLLEARVDGDIARTRIGAVRTVRSLPAGRALAVIRPEHVEVVAQPDGAPDPANWRVIGRRYSGNEILYELAAPDGEHLWARAGLAGRGLRSGDIVGIRLRDVETVAFPDN